MNGTVENTLSAFAPCTITFIISFFWRGGGGSGGGDSKFILKNGNGEREMKNGNRTENGGS